MFEYIKYFSLIFLFALDMQDIENYHNELQSVAVKNNLIGMSIAVVCKNNILDIYHYGKSDIERNININHGTLYKVASISKSVTATALMILYERHQFQLDDDISGYLGYKVSNPNFPNDKITFRMLLTHTSSLQDSTAYDNFLTTTFQQNPPPPLKKLLVPGEKYFENNVWQNKAPGSYFSYCNLNNGLIGTLIEKISGKRFDIFVRQNITGPLGIKGSFNVGDIKNINNLATLYRNSIPQTDNYKGINPIPRDLSQYQIGDNALIYSPQSGFRVSAADLSKFMMMHMNYGKYNGTRILDSATVALMHSSQWKYNGSNGDNYHNLFNNWGLGFHLISNSNGGDIIMDGTKMCGHSGNAYGLISDMYFDTNNQFGFIFITNGYAGEKEYTKAANSAFYKPEAEIFEIIKKLYELRCCDKKRNLNEFRNQSN